MKENQPYLIDVMTKKQKLVFGFLVFVWVINLFIFCVWWSHPAHILSLPRFIITSLLLFWTLGLASYFYFFVGRMKRPNPQISIPANWRVAMVVTKAPSEPFSVVKKTLSAMLEQEYPHDTWLADEEPTSEVLDWCKHNKVHISTRFGVEAYHQPSWPRRTRCKEGNLTYFYDHYGYDNYDFVVQLDADHIPQAGYLKEMIRPFADDQVGYVSAPSICSLNAKTSWTARGRLYAESIMHGPLQAGYTNGFAPLCIGSHYAVRTKALQVIGGLGPELAEDHSTTLLMNAHGWRGVHAIDALAYGNGPESFADCMTQEYQWSRSLTVLLFTLSPRYLKKMPFKLGFQFLFSQLWYPFYSLAMFLGFLIPIYAVLTKEAFVAVSYLNFISRTIPVAVATIAIVWFLKQNNWLRPVHTPLFRWEIGLFNVARWPFTLYGCIMGVVYVITRKQHSFKVTPKGIQKPECMKWKLLSPYIAITVFSFLPVLFIPHAGNATGYYFFLFINELIYISTMIIVILFQVKEARKEKLNYEN